jgi:hypothetical protein
MAQTFCTGPVHVYIGLPTSTPAVVAGPGIAKYYGTTREGPDINEEASYFNVMNDFAGPNLPFDRGYAGAEHTIGLTMTRWDGLIDNALSLTPNPKKPGAVAGTEDVSDRGSMIGAEGLGFTLWLVFGGGTKAINIAGGMRPGRCYFQCVLIGPNKPIVGNKENMRVRIFRAQNHFNVATGKFSLFTEENAAFQGLPAVT